MRNPEIDRVQSTKHGVTVKIRDGEDSYEFGINPSWTDEGFMLHFSGTTGKKLSATLTAANQIKITLTPE